jgi:hypothetical protein
MKCWTCGKEESNADLKINVDRLIGVAQEHFDNEETLNKKAKEKPWYKRSEAEQAYLKHYSTLQDAGNRQISNICEILGIDWQKLYTIARIARKWERKRKWQYCFPVEEHKQKIMEYFIAVDPFKGPNINYIHWNINKKAEKAAKKAA